MLKQAKMTYLLVWMMAAALMIGCGAEDEATQDSGDELVEGVPEAEMLSFSLSEQATTSQPLTLRQDALVGQPSEVRAKAEAVSAEVKEHIIKIHELLDTMKAQGTESTFGKGAIKCKAWEIDNEGVHWKLTACERPGAAKRYGFVLRGRAATSSADADYKLVAAGEHSALGRGANGKRQGAGKVGYNLDNRFALTGKGAKGKAGIGYRAVNRYRHVEVAFKDLLPEGSADAPRSARYTFRRVVGKGGVLRYAAEGDFVTRSAEQALEQGQDGVMERGRATLAWRADGAARTAAVVCGGTVGDGQCARIHQCWQADLAVSYEEISDNPEATPVWEQTSCPSDAELAIIDDAPPTDGEVAPPTEVAEAEEATGLDVAEPAADAALEAAE